MVPEGWKHLRLSEISSTVTSGSRDWAQYYADTGAKFIRMTNLRRGSIWLDLSDLKFVNIQSDSSDGKRTSLQTGDILMSITAELGKIGWVHQGLGEAYINQHTALIRLKENRSSSMFVAYLLSSQEMNSKINRLNDSGAKAGLNLPTIRSIPLNLPPLPEQKKIAQILSTWDKAITTTEQLLANSKQQKKALMQQLLTGKKRLLDKNGVKFSGEWKNEKLASLVYRPLCYGVLKPGENTPGGHPLIRIQDLNGNEELDCDTLICISDELHNEFRRTILNSGDLIISIVGTLGKVFCVPDSLAGANITRAFAVIGAEESLVHSTFLMHYLTSSRIQEWLMSTATGNAQKVLNISAIKELTIPIPAMDEQHKIATVLSAAQQETTILQQKLNALKQEKKGLMQQLLTGKRRVMI